MILREIRLALKEPFRISSGVMSRASHRAARADRRRAARRPGRSALRASSRTTRRDDRHSVARDSRSGSRRASSAGVRRPRGKCTRCSRRTSAATTWRRRRVEMGCWGARRRDARACRSRSCSAARATACRPESRSAFRRSPAALVAARAGRGRRGLSEDQGEDPAGRRTSSSCARCARRSAPTSHLMADANSAYTLDRRRPSRAARRVRPHHDRAAARPTTTSCVTPSCSGA